MDAEAKQALCNILGLDPDTVVYIGIGWMGDGTLVDFADGSNHVYDDAALTAALAKVIYPDEIFDPARAYISLAFNRRSLDTFCNAW